MNFHLPVPKTFRWSYFSPLYADQLCWIFKTKLSYSFYFMSVFENLTRKRFCKEVTFQWFAPMMTEEVPNEGKSSGDLGQLLGCYTCTKSNVSPVKKLKIRFTEGVDVEYIFYIKAKLRWINAWGGILCVKAAVLAASEGASCLFCSFSKWIFTVIDVTITSIITTQ